MNAQKSTLGVTNFNNSVVIFLFFAIFGVFFVAIFAFLRFTFLNFFDACRFGNFVISLASQQACHNISCIFRFNLTSV